jgi:hypothetical protein
MNNEPVAWMTNGKEFYVQKNYCPDFIPLYTHPSEHDLGVAEAIGFDKGYKAATAKTLTDEEILKFYVNNSTYDNDQKLFVDIYGFARAILRKAQEK